MLKLILKAAVILVTIVIVAFVVAAITIPSEKTFTQETEINASREQIWEILNDRAKYPEWQDQITKIDVTDETHWIEYVKNSEPIEFVLVNKEEPASMLIRYKMGEFYTGEWRGELRHLSPTKTVIRTTDKSKVDSTVMKVMMAMFFDIEDFAKDWNQKLKKRAEAK